MPSNQPKPFATRHPLKTIAAVCLAAIVFSGALVAGIPRNQIRSTTDQLVAVLKDPELHGPKNLSRKRALIEEIADKRIDWYGLCQRCLGRHWRQRTPEEKKIFVTTLTRFLKTNYTDIIIENFGDLKEIKYQSESQDGKYALVKIQLVTKDDLETPIFYRMKSKSDTTEWEIIDIVIEGASMVKIYRTQFDEILNNGSFQELIEKIEEKIEALDQ